MEVQLLDGSCSEQWQDRPKLKNIVKSDDGPRCAAVLDIHQLDELAEEGHFHQPLPVPQEVSQEEVRIVNFNVQSWGKTKENKSKISLWILIVLAEVSL